MDSEAEFRQPIMHSMSVVSSSSVQLTPRLIIVPPFEDQDNITNYKKRISSSISHQAEPGHGPSIEEIEEGDETDGKLLEDPSPESEAFPNLRKVFSSRAELGKFLTENLYFQLLVVFLVAVDAVIVIVVDLHLTAHDECHSNSDCPTGEKHLDDHDHLKYCSVNVNYTKCAYYHGHRQCVAEYTPEDRTTLDTLHYVGLAVLTLFMMEVLLRIFALGKDFFKRKLEIFDGLLVLGCFIFYIAYRIQEPFHAAAEAAALIILLRVWRMKRIVNGITRDSQKRNLGKRRLLQQQLKIYKERDDILCEELKTLKEEVRCFRALAEKAEKAENPTSAPIESSM